MGHYIGCFRGVTPVQTAARLVSSLEKVVCLRLELELELELELDLT